MNRARHGSFVDESDHGLRAPRHHHGRPGRHPIVANQLGSFEVRINNLSEWLDLNLIVSNLLAIDRIRCSSRIVNRRNGLLSFRSTLTSEAPSAEGLAGGT